MNMSLNHQQQLKSTQTIENTHFVRLLMESGIICNKRPIAIVQSIPIDNGLKCGEICTKGFSMAIVYISSMPKTAINFTKLVKVI